MFTFTSINYLRKLLIVRHNFLISGLREVSYRLKPFWDLREGVQSILKMSSGEGQFAAMPSYCSCRLEGNVAACLHHDHDHLLARPSAAKLVDGSLDMLICHSSNDTDRLLARPSAAKHVDGNLAFPMQHDHDHLLARPSAAKHVDGKFDLPSCHFSHDDDHPLARPCAAKHVDGYSAFALQRDHDLLLFVHVSLGPHFRFGR